MTKVKLTKSAFLSALEYAIEQACMDRTSDRPIRYSIERAELPLPRIKDLKLISTGSVDSEILVNPIYYAVEKISADRNVQHFKLSVITQMALAERAWEHYQSLPESADPRLSKTTCMSIRC